ncbi:IS1 family transposase [Candidatus Acetothermia bacterium]|nr:IS1 family transposase [Candidatus Acetothermia bacterium]
MVTITLQCRHCQSQNMVRNGFSPNGKQKFRCKDCRRQSRENPTSNAYPPERRERRILSRFSRHVLR